MNNRCEQVQAVDLVFRYSTPFKTQNFRYYDVRVSSELYAEYKA